MLKHGQECVGWSITCFKEINKVEWERISRVLQPLLLPLLTHHFYWHSASLSLCIFKTLVQYWISALDRTHCWIFFSVECVLNLGWKHCSWSGQLEAWIFKSKLGDWTSPCLGFVCSSVPHLSPPSWKISMQTFGCLPSLRVGKWYHRIHWFLQVIFPFLLCPKYFVTDECWFSMTASHQ